MIINDLYLSRAVSNSSLYAAKRDVNNTEKKTDSVFTFIYNFLLAIYYFIACKQGLIISGFKDDFFEGKCLTRTQNAGKAMDAWKYAKCNSKPLQTNQNLLSKVTSKGFKTFYFDAQHADSISLEEMKFSPSPIDGGGKCNGGVAIFLKMVLKGVDEQTIAQEFAEGVPFDGVQQQQLYSALCGASDLDMQVVNSWLGCITANELPDEILNTENARVSNILNAYNLFRITQNICTELSDPLSWINAYFRINGLPDLTDSEKITLHCVDSKLRYGTNGPTRLALEFEDLMIEPKKFVENVPAIETHQSILAGAKELVPGGYKLNFPCYDSCGNWRGKHTIAFYIQEDGTTIFYDPNYGIYKVSAECREKVIKKVFKHYTGYSAKGKNDLYRQLTHWYKGHANPPDNFVFDHDHTCFELLKVKLST